MLSKILSGLFAFFVAMDSYAANLPRKIALEFDPLAPTAALLQTNQGKPTSMWGGAADFNLGHFTMGPEFWVGTFSRKGPDNSNDYARREDFQFGESHKLDATRLRWNIAWYEVPETMRGWYVEGGYNYLRINSRAKRAFYMNSMYAAPANFKVAEGEITESNIADIRHGGFLGFGQRWAFWDYKASVTFGLSYAVDFQRNVSVDARDPDARADYNAIIEEIQDSRLSARYMPEAHLDIGFFL